MQTGTIRSSESSGKFCLHIQPSIYAIGFAFNLSWPNFHKLIQLLHQPSTPCTSTLPAQTCRQLIVMTLPHHHTKGSVIDLIAFVCFCERRRAHGILNLLQALHPRLRDEIKLVKVEGRPTKCAPASTLSRIIDWLLPVGEFRSQKHRSKSLAYLSERLARDDGVELQRSRHDTASRTLTERSTHVNREAPKEVELMLEASSECDQVEIGEALGVVEEAIKELTREDSIDVGPASKDGLQKISCGRVERQRSCHDIGSRTLIMRPTHLSRRAPKGEPSNVCHQVKIVESLGATEIGNLTEKDHIPAERSSKRVQRKNGRIGGPQQRGWRGGRGGRRVRWSSRGVAFFAHS